MKRQYLLTWLRCVLLICCFSLHHAIAETNSVLPSEIQAALKSTTKAFDRIHLVYRESQIGEGVPDYYGGPTRCSLYVQTNRFRLRTEYLYALDKGKPTIHEDTYDGVTMCYGDPRENEAGTPIVVKFLPADKTDPKRDTPLYFRYPSAVGFWFPETIADLASFKRPQSILTHLVSLGHSPSIERSEGHIIIGLEVPDAIVIKAQGTNLEEYREFLLRAYMNGPDWVDKQVEALRETQQQAPRRKIRLLLAPEYGYGIVKREELTITGQPIVVAQSSDWKYYKSGGVWLPGRCVEYYYTERYSITRFSEQPKLTVIHEVVNVDFAAQDNVDFSLNYGTRGTVIIDRTSPEAITDRVHAVTFQVSSNGTERVPEGPCRPFAPLPTGP